MGLMFCSLATDEATMTSSRLIQRLLRRADKRVAEPSRLDVKPPPQLWGQAEPVWSALWHWLRQDKPNTSQLDPHSRLDRARDDFCSALADLRGEAVHDLLCRASSACSLRELWHLRTELYRVVATQRSQGEADRRLALVNQHFPTQATGAPTSTTADRHDLPSHH